MVAAVQGELEFWRMSEVQLRQWVESNPGRVNDRDSEGCTPLIVAASRKEGLPLVVWLLDEKGADMNTTTAYGSALHYVATPDKLTALLARGADPTRVNKQKLSPLMLQVCRETADVVARLLQDPRVRATVNVQDVEGRTALHYAVMGGKPDAAALTVRPLLQAGADLTLTHKNGLTPMAYLRQHRPNHHATIALLERASADVEKTSLLVKARHIAVAASSHTLAPSCLQSRAARGEPLPAVGLVPVWVGRMTTRRAASSALSWRSCVDWGARTYHETCFG